MILVQILLCVHIFTILNYLQSRYICLAIFLVPKTVNIFLVFVILDFNELGSYNIRKCSCSWFFHSKDGGQTASKV